MSSERDSKKRKTSKGTQERIEALGEDVQSLWDYLPWAERDFVIDALANDDDWQSIWTLCTLSPEALNYCRLSNASFFTESTWGQIIRAIWVRREQYVSLDPDTTEGQIWHAIGRLKPGQGLCLDTDDYAEVDGDILRILGGTSLMRKIEKEKAEARKEYGENAILAYNYGSICISKSQGGKLEGYSLLQGSIHSKLDGKTFDDIDISEKITDVIPTLLQIFDKQRDFFQIPDEGVVIEEITD